MTRIQLILIRLLLLALFLGAWEVLPRNGYIKLGGSGLTVYATIAQPTNNPRNGELFDIQKTTFGGGTWAHWTSQSNFLPAQAVFEKNGKATVFVQAKNGTFEAREIQLIKRSESMMVLSGGVKPGEIIAMADPTADKDKKNKGEKKQSGGGPMSGMPASK